MKLLFLIGLINMRKLFIFMSCLSFTVIMTTSQKCDIVNVKTVLWKPHDIDKICWSRTDSLLLYSRRIAQELLPIKVPSNDLGQMLQYFHLLWDSACKISPNVSNSKEVVKIAIGDAIGGYLQSVGLPLAIEAYYAGNLHYKILHDYYDLFNKIKFYLNTDGGGWSAPCNLSNLATKVSALNFNNYPDQPDPFSCQKLHFPVSEKKIAKDPKCPEDLETVVQNDLPTKIVMPLLDDEKSPMAMVVPFRAGHIFSLTSPASAQVLMNYYDLSLRCIGKADKQTMKNFNYAFYNWLATYIVPHLQSSTFIACDGGMEWYTGFGGVIKIIETMYDNGFTPVDGRRDYGLGRRFSQICDESGVCPEGTISVIQVGSSHSHWNWKSIWNNVLTIFERFTAYILLILLLIFLLPLLCYCLHYLFRRKTVPVCKTDGKQPIMSLFYDILDQDFSATAQLNPDDPYDGRSSSGDSRLSYRDSVVVTDLTNPEKSDTKLCKLCNKNSKSSSELTIPKKKTKKAKKSITRGFLKRKKKRRTEPAE